MSQSLRVHWRHRGGTPGPASVPTHVGIAPPAVCAGQWPVQQSMASAVVCPTRAGVKAVLGRAQAWEEASACCIGTVLMQGQRPRRMVIPHALTAGSLGEDGGRHHGVGHAAHDRQDVSVGRVLGAVYKFSRPHTMVGTFISVMSISLLAVQSQGLAAPGAVSTAVAALVQALTSALLMNIAIVGINQLEDVEIDKINKPYLPLASGELSIQAGQALVVGTTVASLAIGVASGSAPLLATLVASLLLGVVYSMDLPFMRWKRSPVLAASCILAVRAVAVQLGFFFHMQAALAAAATAAHVTAGQQVVAGLLHSLGALQVTPAISFTVTFMLLFSVVIALFKDIPDTKGDRTANIRTLTVRLGIPRVFWACIWILTLAYAGAITYSVLAAHFTAAAAPATWAAMPASLSLLGADGGTLGLRTLACVAGHAALAGLLWQRALRTDLSSNADISACYMHVWKLFYAEYILIPLLL